MHVLHSIGEECILYLALLKSHFMSVEAVRELPETISRSFIGDLKPQWRLFLQRNCFQATFRRLVFALCHTLRFYEL